MAARKRSVEIKSKKTVFKGRYKIDEYTFDFDRAAGKGRLTDVKRLVFERGDSAAQGAAVGVAIRLSPERSDGFDLRIFRFKI